MLLKVGAVLRHLVQADYIVDWFQLWPDFDYNATMNAVHEWRRLCRALGLDPDNEQDANVQTLFMSFRHAVERQMLAAHDINSQPPEEPPMGPLAEFFAMAPQFDYNPLQDPVSEWRRLCFTLGLDPDDHTEEIVRQSSLALRSAILRQPLWRSTTTTSDNDQSAHRTVTEPLPAPKNPTESTNNAALILHSSTVSRPEPTQLMGGRVETSQAVTINHIAMFFAWHNQFVYHPEDGIVEQWRRLCLETYHLDPDNREDEEVKQLLASFNTALVRQFNYRFGTDSERLFLWQNLCHCIGIPAHQTIADCRKVCHIYSSYQLPITCGLMAVRL